MTRKLYEEDALLKECAGVVTACVQLQEGWGLELDQTVLFPEGGGQLSDTGWLLPEGAEEKLLSKHSLEKQGRILHQVEKPLDVGTKVQVLLNWTDRLDHMQQHCGEHLLSYAFWKLYGCNNIGFHMSERLVTIDLDKEITAEQADKAEDFANGQIWENRPVTVSHVPHTDLDKYVMRKKNEKITGLLRIVTIKDSDICTCCGTHPPFTGMLGLIKITKFEKYKGGSRVEFLCGRWALEDARAKMRYIQEVSNLLSTKEELVCASVTKLKAEVGELREKLREKTTALQQIELETLLAKPPRDSQGNLVLTAVEADYDPKAAKSMLQKLTVPKAVAAVIYQNGERVNYMFSLGEGAEADCKVIIAKANELFGGKGGGSPRFAQGGGTVSKDWQQKAGLLVEFLQQ